MFLFIVPQNLALPLKLDLPWWRQIIPSFYLEMAQGPQHLLSLIGGYVLWNTYSHRIDKIGAIIKVKIHDDAILQRLWAKNTKTFERAIQKNGHQSITLWITKMDNDNVQNNVYTS